MAGTTYAANSGIHSKEIKPEEGYVLKVLEKTKAFFMCAGEIYVFDREGNKIATFTFSNPHAANQLDCLGSFSRAVAHVEASLTEGETTSGTVSYLP